MDGRVFGSLFFGPLCWCEGQTEHLLSHREGMSPVCRRMECFGSTDDDRQETDPLRHTLILGTQIIIFLAPELFWADTYWDCGGTALTKFQYYQFSLPIINIFESFAYIQLLAFVEICSKMHETHTSKGI